MAEAGQWQADDVEVAAFDARDVTAGAALDGVRAGLVERFFGREIVVQFLFGKWRKVNMRSLDEAAALGVRKANEGHAGYDRMDVAGQFDQHVASVVSGTRFTQDLAVDEDGGVGGDDDRGAYGAGGDEFGFGVGEALHKILRGFAGNRSFVDGGGQHGEGDAGFA